VRDDDNPCTEKHRPWLQAWRGECRGSFPIPLPGSHAGGQDGRVRVGVGEGAPAGARPRRIARPPTMAGHHMLRSGRCTHAFTRGTWAPRGASVAVVTHSFHSGPQPVYCTRASDPTSSTTRASHHTCSLSMASTREPVSSLSCARGGTGRSSGGEGGDRHWGAWREHAPKPRQATPGRQRNTAALPAPHPRS
jgi:hypothetical protein